MSIVRIAIVAAIASLLCLDTRSAAAAAGESPTQLVIDVTDASGAGVAGARVVVYLRARSDARSGLTDSNGQAVFDLAPGRYLVEVEAQGFATPGARRVTLEPGGAQQLSLTLNVGGFETHVVVTGSDRPEPRDENAKALSVVDGRDLATRGVFTLGDAIKDVPGARLEQLGGLGSQTSVRLRGLRAQDTAVLIDGVPFRDVSATQGDATSFLSDLLLTNVERVEVLRGPGSDVYGSNAIGGAINVIQRRGGRPNAGEALLEGGSLGLIRGRVQFGGGLDGDHLIYSVGASRLVVADDVDGQDPARNSSVQGRLSGRIKTAAVSGFLQRAWAFTAINATPVGIGPSTTTVVTATPLSGDQLAAFEGGTPIGGLTTGAANFIPSANDPDSVRRSGSSLMLLQVANQLARWVGYSASYQRVSTSRQFENGPGGVGFQPSGTTQSVFDGAIDTLRIRGDFQVGNNHDVTTAYQAERERYTSESIPVSPAAPSVADVREWSHTASIQERASFLHGTLQLAGGLRAQFFSLRTPAFSPAASAPYQGISFDAPPSAYTGDGSVAYLATPTKTKLRAHVGRGYREPSLFERFGTSFGRRGYSIFGDPGLESERSLGIDAGVDQELPITRSQVSASVFTTALHDVIVFDSSGTITPATDPFGRSSGYRTLAGGRASGLELSTRTQVTASLALTGAYTFNTQSASDDPSAPSLAFGLPRHQGSVQATSRLGRRLDASAVVMVASTYVAPISDAVTFVSRTFRFDGVRRLDLSARYSMPLASRRSVHVFGRIDNVTNETYFESGFRTPGRVVVIGLAGDF